MSNRHKVKVTILVEGPMGSGKSTILHELQQAMVLNRWVITKNYRAARNSKLEKLLFIAEREYPIAI